MSEHKKSVLFPLAYRFFVAHAAPGIVAMAFFAYFLPEERSVVIAFAERGGVAALSAVFGVLVLATVIGLLVDGVAFVTTDWLVFLIRRLLFGQKRIVVRPSDSDDLDFIDRVYEWSYSWYQLYGSVATILMFANVYSMTRGPRFDVQVCVLIWIFAVLFLAASARALARCDRWLSGKFDPSHISRAEYKEI